MNNQPQIRECKYIDHVGDRIMPIENFQMRRSVNGAITFSICCKNCYILHKRKRENEIKSN